MSYFNSPKMRRSILDKARAKLALAKDAELLDSLNFSDWDDAFDHLNATFWRGDLPKIPVTTESTKKPQYGWYGHSGYIKLSINKGLSAKQLLGVLLHEMCHHHVEVAYGHGISTSNGSRVIGHGKHWKQEMRRVGYTGKITKYSGYERFI